MLQRKKALKGQVTTGEQNCSVYGTGSQASEQRWVLCWDAVGRAPAVSGMALPSLQFAAAAVFWESRSQE